MLPAYQGFRTHYPAIVTIDLRKLKKEDFQRFQILLLQQSNLQVANLNEANLAGADLQGAELHAALLRASRLQGADFQNASLQGADLREADLRATCLKAARFDAQTQWSEDFEASLVRGLKKE